MTPTQRMLDVLDRLHWTVADLAVVLHTDAATLHAVLSGRVLSLHPATAAYLARVTQELDRWVLTRQAHGRCEPAPYPEPRILNRFERKAAKQAASAKETSRGR